MSGTSKAVERLVIFFGSTDDLEVVPFDDGQHGWASGVARLDVIVEH